MDIGGRYSVCLLVIALLAGCSGNERSSVAPVEPFPELGADYDPSQIGSIRGTVVWDGPVPDVPPFQSLTGKDSQPGMPLPGPRANPHAPRVNPDNRGVAGAVVFLRNVDLLKSRPWDHQPVQVEQEDWKLNVRQGDTLSTVGFVRRGEPFTAISKQNVLHVLHGEGAALGRKRAFFALPFADPEIASMKIIECTGRVELSSGADFFWMRAHLFVDDHPYYARTDANGRSELPQTPAGNYEIVCWLPNWNVAWQDRHPESGHVHRLGFRPPLEMLRAVTVNAGQTAIVDFVISQKSFGP